MKKLEFWLENKRIGVSCEDDDPVFIQKSAEKLTIIFGKDYNTHYIIPEGFRYLEGSIENGIVIEDDENNQFVWLDKERITLNGTIDGIENDKWFGRRNWNGDNLSSSGYNEKLTPELEAINKSANKYGGFYVSKYLISCVNGVPKSIENGDRWRNIDYIGAKRQASLMSKKWGKGVSAHLMSGSAYDTMIQWIIDNSAANIGDSVILLPDQRLYYAQNIKDVNSAQCTLTQENYGQTGEYITIRGGRFSNSSALESASHRFPVNVGATIIYYGFRLLLCIA